MRWVFALSATVLGAGCSFSGPGASFDASIGDDVPAVDAPPDIVSDAMPDAIPDAIPDAPPDAMIDAAPAGPWRRLLTVPVARAGATELTNFPLWVDVTDAALAAAVGSDTSRIDFRSPSGAALAYDIVAWDPGTGRLRAWVRQTIGNTDRTLYLHYGGPALQPEEPGTVFSNNFVAVWHLDDSPTAAVIDVKGTATGTSQGGMTANDSVGGRMGQAFDFDGVDDAVAFANPITGDVSGTISAWVKLAPTALGGSFDTVVALGTAQTRQARFVQVEKPDIDVGFYNDDWTNTGAVLTLDAWHLVHWTYNAETQTSRLYVDGEQVMNGHAHNTSVNTTGTAGYIGIGLPAFGPSNTRSPFTGAIDEVRLHAASRSQAWIRAEFANQSDPGAFVVPGPTSEL